MAKERLDILLVAQGLAESIDHARRLILAGVVWTAEQRLDKAGNQYAANTPLIVKGLPCRYVSRAGLKLEHALKKLGVSVTGRVCLDVGASTGGFTDCLLQHGALHVFATDVGTSQIDVKMKQHPSVTSLEQQNARELSFVTLKESSPLAKELSFICVDVSFISLVKILSALNENLGSRRLEWVLLFKPQFELEPKWIGRGGVVRESAPVLDCISKLETLLTSLGWKSLSKPIASPLAGKKSGNLEYFLHYESYGPGR